jgi:predicted MFS family arabinose efflux permease
VGVASLLADITPLRRSRNFRRLWVGGAVTSIGSQITVVAIAYQTYRITHSTAMVGLVSLASLVPTLIGSLGGGAIADAVDRRRMLIVTQILLATCSAALALNAFVAQPQLWVLFVVSAAAAAIQGADWPTRLAMLPMIVDAEDLPSAYALQTFVANIAMVGGPALGGLVIARFGLGWAYLVDTVSFGATLVAAVLLPAMAPAGGGRQPGLASIVEGLKYLRSQTLLASTFGLDLVAMIFGMPKAVFPALAVGLYKGGAATIGLLYAAPGAGALAASVLSGWVRHVSYQARALVVCMFVWGGAIAAFGVIPVLWIGLLLLAIAGGADVFGGVFRVAILQRSTPEDLQGRLGGVFLAAAVAGNRLGDGESGLAATIRGPQFAVWSGGVLTIIGTALMAWLVPVLWRNDPGLKPAAGPYPGVEPAVGQIGLAESAGAD